MLATISPASVHLDETLSTLRYACQARTIVNRIRKNEDPNERLIRELKSEVEKITALREELDRLRKVVDSKSLVTNEEKQKEIDELKEKLKESEERMVESQKTWSERVKEAEARKSAELNHLKRCGVAVELHWEEQHPCLVNLAADPILTGTLLYLLPVGIVNIGRETEGPVPDIILYGPLVRPRHCSIENTGRELYLRPWPASETYVNGQLISQTRLRLRHNDRLVIGGDHYFRVSNPYDQPTHQHKRADFEYAHSEILRVQEAKLRAELEQSKAEVVRELEEARMLMGTQQNDFKQQLGRVLQALESTNVDLDREKRRFDKLKEERNVLLEKVEEQNTFKLSPYRSTFFQELEDVYCHSTSDMSLHELNLMVREASQRSQDMGVILGFVLQHTVCEYGLEPMIKVKRRTDRRFAMWTLGTFKNWLNIVREQDQEEVLREWTSMNSNMDWESDNESDSESAPNRRLSINTEQVRKKIRKSRSSQGREAVPDQITQYLDQMSTTAQLMVDYCNRHEPCMNERMKLGMKHFQMFMQTITGVCSEGKTVRFDVSST